MRSLGGASPGQGVFGIPGIHGHQGMVVLVGPKATLWATVWPAVRRGPGQTLPVASGGHRGHLHPWSSPCSLASGRMPVLGSPRVTLSTLRSPTGICADLTVGKSSPPHPPGPKGSVLCSTSQALSPGPPVRLEPWLETQLLALGWSLGCHPGDFGLTPAWPPPPPPPGPLMGHRP